MRTGITRKGKVVAIGTLAPVRGGWEGYVVNGEGRVVLVFVPTPTEATEPGTPDHGD